MLEKQQNRKPRYLRQPTRRIEIQERDIQIVYQIYKHRFLSSRHIHALIGGSEQAIQKTYFVSSVPLPKAIQSN